MEDLAERIRKANAMLLLSNQANEPQLKTCYQIVRCLGISTDKLLSGRTLDENSATREITRMAATCTSKQLWFY